MAKVISMRRDPGDQPQSRLPHAKSQGGRPGLPIGPVVEEYLQSAKRHLGAQTYREYRRHLRAFAAWADGRKIGLEYINRRVVEEFCEHLFATRQNIRKSGPISRHAVSNYVLVIKVFLHATRRDSIIYGEYLSTDPPQAGALSPGLPQRCAARGTTLRVLLAFRPRRAQAYHLGHPPDDRGGGQKNDD